jgi:peroxiredoxin Q/BCP
MGLSQSLNFLGILSFMFRRSLFSLFFGLAFTLFLSLVNLAPALALGGTQLPLNEAAPNFSLPSNSGDREISLSDYRGKWVVLYFYPKDFTSGCTLEAKRFQKDLPQYRAKNTQVLGVSVDDVQSHAEFCDSEGLTFPLLADTTGTVSKQYSSWLSGMSLRHTYLIDPDGILRDRFLGVQPAIHSSEVLARLEELQAVK